MPGVGGEVGIGPLLSIARFNLGAAGGQYNTKNRQSDPSKEDLPPSI
jgi:hypothetical protein